MCHQNLLLQINEALFTKVYTATTRATFLSASSHGTAGILPPSNCPYWVTPFVLRAPQGNHVMLYPVLSYSLPRNLME